MWWTEPESPTIGLIFVCTLAFSIALGCFAPVDVMASGKPTPQRIAIEAVRLSEPVLTEREIDLVARVVAAEAEDEPYDGKIAVANVIFNRWRSGRWGDTIESVLYAKHQFAKPRRYASDDCYHAVRDAIKGVETIPPGVMYFRMASSWRRGRCVAKIGGHYFYVLKGE